MKTELVLTGKTKPAYIEEGMEEYIKRIRKHIRLTVHVLPDLKGAGKLSGSEIREKEGDLLLKNVKPKDFVILLDERGDRLTSAGFAEFLSGKMVHATANLVFVAGGAYGFSGGVYRRKDFMLSLSPMTFSHQLVRLVFLEQLYRALTIINNEPYHLAH